jgi:hypothetical protein
MDRPDFPTMEQVEKADREQLAHWYRFLPSGDTSEQRKIQPRLAERFQKMGGMTPDLSKKIGFGGEWFSGFLNAHTLEELLESVKPNLRNVLRT